MVAPRTGAPEITIAEDQEQYHPVTAAKYVLPDGIGLLTRWRLTDEERAAIASGADFYLMQMTFGDDMQPIRPSIGVEPWMTVKRPTRLSVRDDDPGYAAWTAYAHLRPKISVDGTEVSSVITADEELGVALVFIRDDDGKRVLNPDNPLELLTRELTGKVEIRWPDGAFPS